MGQEVVERSKRDEQEESLKEIAAAAALQPNEVVYGRVISVVSGGIFSSGGILVDEGGRVGFVTGHFDKVEGDFVKVEVALAGTYRYTSAIGGQNTVRAFRALREIK
jgi:hypothetical protein